MKLLLSILLITLAACTGKTTIYHHVILDQEVVNLDLIDTIDESEKALLSYYLFAFGNACDGSTDKIKCAILDALHIEDECAPTHIDFLKKWMGNNTLAKFKLMKCPVISAQGAIQNTIKHIVIDRDESRIRITIHTKGLNNREEKTWDIEQVDDYLIHGSTLIMQ